MGVYAVRLVGCGVMSDVYVVGRMLARKHFEFIRCHRYGFNLILFIINRIRIETAISMSEHTQTHLSDIYTEYFD